jgi:hypothetical protein
MVLIIPPDWLKTLVTKKESELSEEEKEELQAWRNSQMITIGALGVLALMILGLWLSE